MHKFNILPKLKVFYITLALSPQHNTIPGNYTEKNNNNDQTIIINLHDTYFPTFLTQSGWKKNKK